MSRYLLIAVLTLLFPLASLADERDRVAYQVFCENQAVGKKISNAVANELKRYKRYEVSEKFPRAKLFIYAQQDVNDRKKDRETARFR